MSDAGKKAADDEKIILGRISGVYGVKGWVKVFSDTEPREGICQYSPWYLKSSNINHGQWREIRMESGRRHGKTVIVKLEGFDDRDESMLLTGAVIGINPEQMEALEGDEYYWRELIDLRVINQQDIELGTVEQLLETGANDVLVVKGGPDDQERLIPWTPGHAVLAVDLEQGLIRVDWDEDF